MVGLDLAPPISPSPPRSDLQVLSLHVRRVNGVHSGCFHEHSGRHHWHHARYMHYQSTIGPAPLLTCLDCDKKIHSFVHVLPFVKTTGGGGHLCIALTSRQDQDIYMYVWYTGAEDDLDPRQSKGRAPGFRASCFGLAIDSILNSWPLNHSGTGWMRLQNDRDPTLLL